MHDSELLVQITFLLVLFFMVCAGGGFLRYPFDSFLDFGFTNYSTERINAEWSVMPFFLGGVIVLGLFFAVGAVGPFLQASQRPAPTYIADVDPASKPVKSVSNKTAPHHKHSSHQRPVHDQK
jgi:hypothetical protein